MCSAWNLEREGEKKLSVGELKRNCEMTEAWIYQM